MAAANKSSKPKHLEPKRETARRFGVCTKTVDRWVDRGILGRPIKINGRDYFDTNTTPIASKA